MTDQPLTEAEITSRLRGSRWRHEGDAIVLEIELENFDAAIAAVNRVAAAAQEHDHHPDILVHGWNKLTLTLSTHSAGGITAADFALATACDGLL